MDKIHIMHIIYALDTGGMQKGLINLVNGMDSTIFINSICCLTKSGRYAEQIKDKGIKIFEMQKKEKQAFSLPLRLSKILKEEKIDIVHARCWGALFEGVIGANIAKIPIIIYGEHGRRYEDIIQPKKRRVWLRRILLSFMVDKIVAVSNEVKEWLVHSIGVTPEKIVCIHNGIDFNENNFDVCRKEKEDIGLQDEDVVIGTVGRLDGVKDYATLLYAVPEVIKHFPKVKFLFIGNGPLQNDLENLVVKLGIEQQVVFLGDREDAIELLRLMDIFVLTSLIEGISNSLLEASLLKLPIVATNVGGNSEIVKDGVTGFLVPPKSPSLFAEAIIKILQNPSKSNEMGLAGKEWVQQHFRLDTMITAYEHLYKTLAKEKIRSIALSTNFCTEENKAMEQMPFGHRSSPHYPA